MVYNGQWSVTFVGGCNRTCFMQCLVYLVRAKKYEQNKPNKKHGHAELENTDKSWKYLDNI